MRKMQSKIFEMARVKITTYIRRHFFLKKSWDISFFWGGRGFFGHVRLITFSSPPAIPTSIHLFSSPLTHIYSIVSAPPPQHRGQGGGGEP